MEEQTDTTVMIETDAPATIFEDVFSNIRTMYIILDIEIYFSKYKLVLFTKLYLTILIQVSMMNFVSI